MCYYNISITGHIQVFDSVHDNISSDTVNQICSIVCSQKKSITIEIMDVVKQSGSTDCGLFALAFATSLCHGEVPVERRYKQGELRTHLRSVLECNSPSRQPFPSSYRRKIPANIIKRTMVIPVFCSCRMPEQGSMVECCQCSEWYHEECEKVDVEIWEKEEIDWICTKCSSQRVKRRE